MKSILRLMVLPVVCILLAGTALIEFMYDKPDWESWKTQNDVIILLLPITVRKWFKLKNVNN